MSVERIFIESRTSSENPAQVLADVLPDIRPTDVWGRAVINVAGETSSLKEVFAKIPMERFSVKSDHLNFHG